MKHVMLLVCLLALTLLIYSGIATSQTLTPQEELGKFLYFDENLSEPDGQACASCHHPDFGFADPDQDLPVSQGVLEDRFGNRNSPSSAYAAFSPDFHWDEVEEMYIGGQFWDGRAMDLAEQAKGPFLNPLEMHNRIKRQVIMEVYRSDYADLFEEVYGVGSLRDIETAYDQVAEAIAAFEATDELNQFTSKYDYYLLGMVDLTDQEALGLELFEDEDAGNCAACHPSEPGPYNENALFTDYSYDNLGVPKNWDNPFLYLPPPLNPAGEDFIDYGLGAIVGDEDEMGKVKVPTLRNIALTAPYMHNGEFETLTEVVDFYNTRDVPGAGWDPPEVPENVNTDELGDLGLTSDEVAAIVAFMETLTDGYEVAAGGSETVLAANPSVTDFALFDNYPNPFNPTTTISYALPEASHVNLTIYNVNGQAVTTLVDGYRSASIHQVTFDASHLSSGLYFYKIEAGNYSDVKKMVLVK